MYKKSAPLFMVALMILSLIPFTAPYADSMYIEGIQISNADPTYYFADDADEGEDEIIYSQADILSVSMMDDLSNLIIVVKVNDIFPFNGDGAKFEDRTIWWRVYFSYDTNYRVWGHAEYDMGEWKFPGAKLERTIGGLPFPFIDGKDLDYIAIDSIESTVTIVVPKSMIGDPLEGDMLNFMWAETAISTQEDPFERDQSLDRAPNIGFAGDRFEYGKLATIRGEVLDTEGFGINDAAVMVGGMGIDEPFYATTNFYGGYSITLPAQGGYYIKVMKPGYEDKIVKIWTYGGGTTVTDFILEPITEIPEAAWWNTNWQYRVPITISNDYIIASNELSQKSSITYEQNGHRLNPQVSIPIDFAEVLANIDTYMYIDNFDPDSIRVVEYDEYGSVRGSEVPFTFDPAGQSGASSDVLTIVVPGRISAPGDFRDTSNERYFYVYFDTQGESDRESLSQPLPYGIRNGGFETGSEMGGIFGIGTYEGADDWERQSSSPLSLLSLYENERTMDEMNVLSGFSSYALGVNLKIGGLDIGSMLDSYTLIEQTFNVPENGNAPSYRIHAFVTGSSTIVSAVGFTAQILIDDEVVWERDASKISEEGMAINVDATEHLKGKRDAKITIKFSVNGGGFNLDLFGFAAYTYWDNIRIETPPLYATIGIPEERPFDIPPSSPYNVSITTQQTQSVILAGQSISYPIILENLGTAAYDVVELSLTGTNAHWAYLNKDAVRLEHGESEAVTLTVMAPPTIDLFDTAEITVNANSKGDPEHTDALTIVTRAFVEMMPDLVIETADISIKPGTIIGIQDVTVSAKVYNEGQDYASAVTVGFYMDDEFIESRTISNIGVGQRGEASMTWTSVPGNHTLSVVVDENDDILEMYETNNVATKVFTVEEDTEAPTIELAGAIADRKVGERLRIAAVVEDNALLDSVVITIVAPDGSQVMDDMTKGTNNEYYYDTTFSMVGDYTYTITATDSSGHEAMSETEKFTLTPSFTLIEFLQENWILLLLLVAIIALAARIFRKP